jgi:hypothetical protein
MAGVGTDGAAASVWLRVPTRYISLGSSGSVGLPDPLRFRAAASPPLPLARRKYLRAVLTLVVTRALTCRPTARAADPMTLEPAPNRKRPYSAQSIVN